MEFIKYLCKSLRMIREVVKKTKGYSLSVQSCAIELNQNESPYDLPAPLKKEILKQFKKLSWNRYPTAYCDPLRKKIGKKEGWSPDGVIVSGGSNILIQAIVIASAIGAGAKILTVSPSFSLYALEGTLLGNRVIEVPLEGDDFSFPLEAFLKALKRHRPRLIFLANPNAPTGNLFSQKVLKSVIDAAKKTSTLVVIDEAYYPFSGVTSRPFLKHNPHLLIVRTFSKAFSLGGVRLGYLMGDPKIVSEILKVTLPFSVGLLSQTVGECVLENDSYVQSIVREITHERDIVYAGLKKIKGLKVYPSETNFILFQSPQAKRLFEGLYNEGILIREVSGRGLSQSLRVTIGSPSENRKFLSATQKIMKKNYL